MEFKKLNKLQKALLKMRDRDAYYEYKFLNKLQDAPQISLEIPGGDTVSFRHSGNAGDLMYALPSMYAIAGNRPIHLYLNINQPANYGKMKHPLGQVMLNEKMLHALQPLLLQQHQVAVCEAYAGQHIDVDLDQFRRFPFNYHMSHIARWYFHVHAITADLGKPWLRVPTDPNVSDTIVIARSQRYRQPGIDYSFLNGYPRISFLGLEEEYREMKAMIPKLEYHRVSNFLEMASVIKGSRFFIGNQSFPFSIAEGIKKLRILEVYHRSPNVIVEGAEGYDFVYQPQFEKIVSDLFQRTS